MTASLDLIATDPSHPRSPSVAMEASPDDPPWLAHRKIVVAQTNRPKRRVSGARHNQGAKRGDAKGAAR